MAASSHDGGTQVGIPQDETSNAEVKTFMKCATVVSASVSGCVSVFCCLCSRWVDVLFTFPSLLRLNEQRSVSF